MVKEYLTFNVGDNGATNDAAAVTAEKMRIQGNGNVGIGTTSPDALLTVAGPIALNTPQYLSSDYYATPYVMTATDSTLIFTNNNAHTQLITLQAASSYPGRILFLSALVSGGTFLSSDANNVVLITGGSAQAVILSLANGKSCMILQSKNTGTNWQVIAIG